LGRARPIRRLVLGLLTPARRLLPASVAREWANDLEDDPSAEQMQAMTRLARHSVSPAERIAHVLHPWSSFLIVPVFALANAGVSIKADAFDTAGSAAVSAGIILGLVLGKTLGITGAAWLGTRLGVARLPDGANWLMMFAIAAVAGIGFTVSLFVAELAFAGGALQDAAKLGVLAASTVAAIIGGVALSRACRDEATPASV
jgi:NhaA family Na+:H+ antiporter